MSRSNFGPGLTLEGESQALLCFTSKFQKDTRILCCWVNRSKERRAYNFLKKLLIAWLYCASQETWLIWFFVWLRCNLSGSTAAFQLFFFSSGVPHGPTLDHFYSPCLLIISLPCLLVLSFVASLSHLQSNLSQA